MSCKVSPLLAFARVYSFEKLVPFGDTHYINLLQGRHVIEAYTLASSRSYTKICRVAALDPACKLSWEIEFLDDIMHHPLHHS